MPIAAVTHAAISGRKPSFSVASRTNAFTPALREPSYLGGPVDMAFAAYADAPSISPRRPTLSRKSALPSLSFCDLIAVFASFAT